MPMLSKKKVEELRKTRLFRVIDTKNGHHGYTYKVGLNEDPKEFGVRGKCVSGGLYFTNPQNLISFWNYGDRVAEVEIPEGEPVFEVSSAGPLKYRAKRIIVSALYRKGEIIDKLIELGMSVEGDCSGAMLNDVINGVVDEKYLPLYRLNTTALLAADHMPSDKRIRLLKLCLGAGRELSYYNGCINSKNVHDIISAGYKVPVQYVMEQTDLLFYTAPNACKHLLENVDGKFARYRVENLVRHGHVAIIRELAKRDLLPENIRIEFDVNVSKDRKREIRKLCAK
jgi:hypothetical protein